MFFPETIMVVRKKTVEEVIVESDSKDIYSETCL